MGCNCKECVLVENVRVPEFPEFSPIDFSHLDMAHKYFKLAQPEASEYTFTNLYAWRRHYNFQLSLLDDNLIVLAKPLRESPFFLAPVGEFVSANTVESMMNYQRDEGMEPKMARVPATLAERLSREIDGLIVEEDRANWDYVYLAENLSELAGRKYHRKRNNIKRFSAENDYVYTPMTPELIPDCIRMQEEWCKVRDCYSSMHLGLAAEHKATMDGLINFEKLGLIGGTILIDGRVEAFCIAEQLNLETMVMHFEKGSPHLPGIYQVISQEFCAQACRGYTYVNREQDLGEDGLRKAKESYFPHHMVEKSVVRRQF